MRPGRPRSWNNQPAIDGATLGAIGSVTADGWYDVDVTGVVKGNGTFSFGATSSSTDCAYCDARESDTDAPQLVVTTGTTTTPPPSGDPVLVGADPAGAGQPRLQHLGFHRLLRLLRGAGRPVGPGLLLLQPRQLAHRLAQLQHQHEHRPCTLAYWLVRLAVRAAVRQDLRRQRDRCLPLS